MRFSELSPGIQARLQRGCQPENVHTWNARTQVTIAIAVRLVCSRWDGEKLLGFVGLLAARANQVFDRCGSFCALSLFKFGDPIGNRVDNVVGSLAGNFRFAPLAVYALSTFDDFYFFVGHKLIQK
ncbi:MAG: hypothetical protein DMF73_07560 [Acidobacteria bacterium]|nr:MAG: hypothetical protein DMF73_07560 [Acidobacteriota bacterium]